MVLDKDQQAIVDEMALLAKKARDNDIPSATIRATVNSALLEWREENGEDLS